MIETRFLDSVGANSNLSSDALARPFSLASSAHHAGQTGLFGPFEAGQYPITPLFTYSSQTLGPLKSTFQVEPYKWFSRLRTVTEKQRQNRRLTGIAEEFTGKN